VKPKKQGAQEVWMPAETGKKTKAAPNGIEIKFEDQRPLAEQEVDRIKAQAVRDIFGPGANPNKRYIATYEQAGQYATFLKGLGLQVVYTAGVWDMLHIGHCRYFEKAKECGDILIVSVETDESVKLRKGPNRPVVPFNERVEMLCHIRHIDLIVPIPDFDEQGKSGIKMIEAIQPNTIVASERSFREYDDTTEWVNKLKKYSNHIEILESQAETSTSNKIRDLVLSYGDILKGNLKDTQKTVTAALAEAWQEMEKKIDESVKKL
jgi:cytidyltransferase-like protein